MMQIKTSGLWLFVFHALSLLMASAEATPIFQCKINGKTVFTDQPCEGKTLDLRQTNFIPSVETTAPSEQEPPVYSSDKWYYNISGYRSALKVAERYDAPVFIYYQADWCGYCRRLEKELLNRAGAKKLLHGFVKIQITPDDGRQENTLFKSMGGRGYPTIYIKRNADSKPIRRVLSKGKKENWRALSIDEFGERLADFK